MKVFGFKSNSVQEKIVVSDNIEVAEFKSKETSKKSLVSQDINIKNFKTTIEKLKTNDDLDLDKIEQLRAELNSKTITTDKIAESMINYLKNNSWHKHL